jgi:hypothetical protein
MKSALLKVPPRLAEWQEWDKTTNDIHLNRSTLLDILATTDASWGHFVSLSRCELIEYLEEQELERRVRQERQHTHTSVPSSSSLARQHFPHRRLEKEIIPASPMTHNHQRPFPLGLAPILKRTDPATGQRTVVIGYSQMNANNKQYLFAQEKQQQRQRHARHRVPKSILSTHSSSSQRVLLDQSYAEIMLRLHPLVFLTLYEYEKNRGRMGVCCYSKAGMKKKSMMQNSATNNGYTFCCSNDTIILGGVALCSRALLCALARSHAVGQYSQLTMEEILCYEPFCICSRNFKHNNKNDSSATQCTTRR